MKRLVEYAAGFTPKFWLILCGVLLGLLLVAAGAFAVQTTRIEGFKLWPLSTEGWKPKAERLALELARIDIAQEHAARDALAARLATEAKYRTLAENADDRIVVARGAAGAAAARFIAANRVRAEAARCPAGGARETPGGDGAGVPAPVPADAIVAVGDADVRACTGAAIYAHAARDWALSLETASNEGN